MNNIIAELEKDHAEIMQALDELLDHHATIRTDSLRLTKLETLLLNHISREDSEIYTPLRKLIRLDQTSAKFLEGSRQDLESLKIKALIFFEKHKESNNEALSKSFHADLKKLTENLRDRMDFEDTQLFPFLRDFWGKI